MKVLKEPDLTWIYKFTCTKCCAELQAEAGDLYVRYYPGNFREEPYNTYYVTCPRCQEQHTITSNNVPQAVRNNAKKASNNTW